MRPSDKRLIGMNKGVGVLYGDLRIRLRFSFSEKMCFLWVQLALRILLTDMVEKTSVSLACMLGYHKCAVLCAYSSMDGYGIGTLCPSYEVLLE